MLGAAHGVDAPPLHWLSRLELTWWRTLSPTTRSASSPSIQAASTFPSSPMFWNAPKATRTGYAATPAGNRPEHLDQPRELGGPWRYSAARAAAVPSPGGGFGRAGRRFTSAPCTPSPTTSKHHGRGRPGATGIRSKHARQAAAALSRACRSLTTYQPCTGRPHLVWPAPSSAGKW